MVTLWFFHPDLLPLREIPGLLEAIPSRARHRHLVELSPLVSSSRRVLLWSADSQPLRRA
jgi:hypothetical protein